MSVVRETTDESATRPTSPDAHRITDATTVGGGGAVVVTGVMSPRPAAPWRRRPGAAGR